MARPPRYNAEYYTHDADLRNDRRIKAIRTQLGAAGYGILHMLLEVLTAADHTRIDISSELEMELLAGDLGVSAADIRSVVQAAERVGFLARNKAGWLVCPDLDRALEPVFDKRERERKRSENTKKTKSGDVNGAGTTVSAAETPQSKEKESREKKREDPPYPPAGDGWGAGEHGNPTEAQILEIASLPGVDLPPAVARKYFNTREAAVTSERPRWYKPEIGGGIVILQTKRQITADLKRFADEEGKRAPPKSADSPREVFNLVK